MPPAVIAGVGAVGTIGGALLSSSAQKKASKQANAAEQQATQAQLQLGRESMALNKDIYNSNYATLSPFVSRGDVAGTAINALLGLPTAPVMRSPLAPPAPGGAPQHNAIVGQTPMQPAASPVMQTLGGGIMAGQAAMGTGQSPAVRALMMGGEPFGLAGSMGPGSPLNGNHLPMGGGHTITPQPVLGGNPAPVPPPAGGNPATGGTPTQTPATAYNALNDFANSAGMKFQLQEGVKALNNGYAAHGLLQSGAAMKGINDYAQQTALNNYFMPYMGLLGGQQSTGAGAASSIAGVGANFANSAAAINSGMGNALQNGANATAQNAYNRGAANSQLYGQIGSALGGLASSFAPRGY